MQRERLLLSKCIPLPLAGGGRGRADCLIPLALAISGCSLLVPGNGDLDPNLGVDAGYDAGPPERDAGPDAGMDAGPPCAPGLDLCSTGCADTQTALAHCGVCENACAATDMCRAGECIDPVVEVSADVGHTCARRGGGSVWCWGYNNRGQIGDGTTIDRRVPVRVAGLADAQRISTGTDALSVPWYGFSCAVRAAGDLVCWGSTFGSTGPAEVMEVGSVTDVALLGPYVISVDGRVFRWMPPDATGTPTPPVEEVPAGVTGPWAAELGIGLRHHCAVHTSGDVYCWGMNPFGEAGDAAIAAFADPTPVAGWSDAAEVSAGIFFTCSRSRSGSVACWGREDYLGIGSGATDPHAMPELVSVQMASAIDVRRGQACAVHGANGNVSCWGADATSPVQVPGITGAVDVATSGVATSGGHTCVALSSGSVACWGENQYGQLGDGTTDDRTVPTPVVGLP